MIERNGKLVHDVIQIDDRTNVEKYTSDRMTKNEKYWADRWADQMNYRYWKERSQAERTRKGTQARQLFYEGTKAYKTADFALASAKFKEGLLIWKDALKDFPVFRDDDLNKKDTGLVVKRYERVLMQENRSCRTTLPSRTCWPRPRPTQPLTPSMRWRCSGCLPTPRVTGPPLLPCWTGSPHRRHPAAVERADFAS